MKGLDSLIRIAKWRVDEARRNLAELDRLAEGLRDRLCALDEEVARERTVAAADPEAARSFAGYRAAAAILRSHTRRAPAPTLNLLRGISIPFP